MVLGSKRGRLAVLAAAQAKGKGERVSKNKKTNNATQVDKKNNQVFGALNFSPREEKSGMKVYSHSKGLKKHSPAPGGKRPREDKSGEGKQLAAPQIAPAPLERSTSFGKIVRREDSFAPQREVQERTYTPTKMRHVSPLSHFKVAKRSRLNSSPSKASLHRQRELVLSPPKKTKPQEMLLHTPVKTNNNRRTEEEEDTNRIPVPLMPRTPEIHTPIRDRDSGGWYRTSATPRVREYATSTYSTPPSAHAQAAHLQREESSSQVGRRGLVNLGNTCYLNAITSVLLHLPRFCREVLAVNAQDFLNTQSVCLALQNLLRKKDLRSSSAGVDQQETGLNPMALKECIASFAAQFQGNLEQDAHEFYCILLEMIEKEYLQIKLAMKCRQEEGKRALKFTESLQETGCPSSRTFMGSVEHVFTCSVCKNESSVIETFKDISLTLDEGDGGGGAKMSHTLQSLVKQHFATEVISKDCEKCKSQSVPHTLVYKLRRLPSVFVVHLKRLTTVRRANGDLALQKSTCDVDVTQTLELGQFCDQRTCVPVQCSIGIEGSDMETPVKVRGGRQSQDYSVGSGFEALDMWKNSTTPPKFLDICHNDSNQDGRSGDLQEKRWVESAIEESLRDSNTNRSKDHKTPQKQITLISTESTNLAPNTPEEFPASSGNSLKVVDNLDCQTFASIPNLNSGHYSLSAVISHLGGPTSGHYISHLKQENTGQWLCYNDENVTKCGWKDLQRQSQNCYMLFYCHK